MFSEESVAVSAIFNRNVRLTESHTRRQNQH